MQCQFQQKLTDVVAHLTEYFWDHGRYNIGQLSVFILSVNENFQLEVKILYRYASLNDVDTFWQMRRYAISSLCERVPTQA